MKAYLWFWLSLLGCELANEIILFSAGVHTFQSTGALADLSAFYLIITVPRLLLSPFSGRLIDRFPLSRVLSLSLLGNVLLSSVITILQDKNGLEGLLFWMYGLRSVIVGIESISLTKLVPLLVETNDLHRANSILDLQRTLPRLLAGLIGGLVAELHLNSTILYINTIPYLLPFFALRSINRSLRLKELDNKYTPISFKPDIKSYFETISKFSLTPLLAFLFIGSIALAFYGTLLTPLILKNAGPLFLGGVSTAAGIGALVGSIVSNLLPGSTASGHRLIIAANFGQGLSLLLAAGLGNPFLVGLSYAIFICLDVLGKAFNYSIWQKKVPSEIQGRIFGVNKFLISSFSSLSILACGNLVDFLKTFSFKIHFLNFNGEPENTVIVSILLFIGLVQLLTSLYYWKRREVILD